MSDAMMRKSLATLLRRAADAIEAGASVVDCSWDWQEPMRVVDRRIPAGYHGTRLRVSALIEGPQVGDSFKPPAPPPVRDVAPPERKP